MIYRISCCWFGAKPSEWIADEVIQLCSDGCPTDVQPAIERVLHASPAAVLFWDGSLGVPDLAQMQALIQQPGDVWHGGLRLGTGGLPGIIDFVHPTWMHNCDPDPTIEATSWRLSLNACLVRTEVLRQLGGLRVNFESLDAAALEMGHRFLRRGAILRHVPALVPQDAVLPPIMLSIEDEIRFAIYRFGRKWAGWALMRAMLTGYRSRTELLAAWRRVRREQHPTEPLPYRRSASKATRPTDAKVTVLIPTLERYPYLHTVLDQLRTQTIRPQQIIVVDQTPWVERDEQIAATYPDLPLDVIYQDESGQCTSRNAGLYAAEGDFVLFIDDDDEIEPDLIERHLRNLHQFGCDVSSGVADEAGAGPLPPDFRLQRVSDVFPTNNTLIWKNVLHGSGLFDLAYNRGQRADGDLGMRIYLSGALMVLDPEISVFHHHAPRGGLRAHKARVITYSSSRQRLLHRQLPSVSEIYLMRRYFTDRQVREALWIRAAGTFSLNRSRWKQLAKAGLGIVLLPHTLYQFYKRYHQATEMLTLYPQIPSFREKDTSCVSVDGEK